MGLPLPPRSPARLDRFGKSVRDRRYKLRRTLRSLVPSAISVKTSSDRRSGRTASTGFGGCSSSCPSNSGISEPAGSLPDSVVARASGGKKNFQGFSRFTSLEKISEMPGSVILRLDPRVRTKYRERFRRDRSTIFRDHSSTLCVTRLISVPPNVYRPGFGGAPSFKTSDCSLADASNLLSSILWPET